MAARITARPYLLDTGYVREALAIVDMAATLPAEAARGFLEMAADALPRSEQPGSGLGKLILRRAARAALYLTPDGEMRAQWGRASFADMTDEDRRRKYGKDWTCRSP